MNHSAPSPRSTLVARARKHFIAIAAASVVLTGGMTAYAATSGAATQTTSTGTGQGASTSHDSSGSGLTAPAANSSTDGSSNAS
jgi:hypothetical protein